MTHQKPIPFMLIRGGSSKGVYFKKEDLPQDDTILQKVLLYVMGAYGDKRQVDGLGGAHPLTSKIAIVSLSEKENCDLDYLFIQAIVGEEKIDKTPNCGNILAGVGAFALESGLIKLTGERANLKVNMINSENICELNFPIQDGFPIYEGQEKIDGVLGTSARVICNYANLAGSICGVLFPTGNMQDTFDGYQVTCIDNGMPVVVLRAENFGIIGNESSESLNNNEELKQKIESIRLQAGFKMNLGDVKDKAIPKMCLVSKPEKGGTMNTRTFIPKVCHTAIGVLGAVSAASAAIFSDSAIYDLADIPTGENKNLKIEHPSGFFDVSLEIEEINNQLEIKKAGLVRTARLIAKGEVYIPQVIWNN